MLSFIRRIGLVATVVVALVAAANTWAVDTHLTEAAVSSVQSTAPESANLPAKSDIKY